MNGQHLRAFLWLRWRLRLNQMKRGGTANAIIMAVLIGAAVCIAVLLFVGFLSVGLFSLSDEEPALLMYFMDVAVLAFLFVWVAGLLSELQRSEALSLTKFLHLPVSVSGAFLINYVSSLPSVTLLWFVSAMLGVSFGLVYSRGWAMLWLLPMLAAFVLMVTALTYQFQGWLAALMSNPRRRRTIIVVATMIFILIFQVPNLLHNVIRPWHMETMPKTTGASAKLDKERRDLYSDFVRKKISEEEFHRRELEIEKRRAEIISRDHTQQHKEQTAQIKQWEQTIRLMNLLFPPGWLAAGIEAAAENRPWPVLLAILGPVLIGTASLGRAYRTTMRLYTGQYTSEQTAVTSQPAQDRARPQTSAVRSAVGLLERKLPGLSEQATVITLAAFRSLLRAPEAKMLLLSSILLLLVFGSTIATTSRGDMPDAVRPMLGFGAMVLVLWSMSPLLGNQFGFDRDGFRVFVLSPARRRDILLGKDLAVAPIALVLSAAAVILVQVVFPMRWDRFLALAPRFVSMYLLYCLVANTMSILVPLRIASGSFQPVKPGGIIILIQLVIMFLCPAILSLTLLPLVVELLVEIFGRRHGVPIDLLLSLLECAVILVIYGFLLGLQGKWLQAREQRILQMVTTRSE